MLLPELSARLSSQSLVGTWTVSLGYMPDQPDTVIALYETGGTGYERFLGSTGTVEQPAVQVRVRGAADDYAIPRAKIDAIAQAMADWGAFTSSGTRYLSFTPLQSPFVFNRDSSRRVEFAVNFLVQKELSAS